MIIPCGIIYHDISGFALDAYRKWQSEYLRLLLENHLQITKLITKTMQKQAPQHETSNKNFNKF